MARKTTFRKTGRDTGLRNRKICRVGERRERGDFIYGPRLLCGGNEGFDLSVRVIEVTIPK
ncbi:MAG: hypothetical protein Q8Q12_16440, partial [bacterium]|nr:hypothetical protein [bacterium]